jgi:hypothetical protein
VIEITWFAFIEFGLGKNAHVYIFKFEYFKFSGSSNLISPLWSNHFYESSDILFGKFVRVLIFLWFTRLNIFWFDFSITSEKSPEKVIGMEKHSTWKL